MVISILTERRLETSGLVPIVRRVAAPACKPGGCSVLNPKGPRYCYGGILPQIILAIPNIHRTLWVSSYEG